MAARSYGDMPLGSKPFLPQFETSKARQKPRAKTQALVVTEKGMMTRHRGEEEEVDKKAVDPAAHVSGARCRAAVRSERATPGPLHPLAPPPQIPPPPPTRAARGPCGRDARA